MATADVQKRSRTLQPGNINNFKLKKPRQYKFDSNNKIE